MTILFTQFGMAVLILIGMVAVFYPEKIQTIELKMSEVLTFGIPNPMVSFLRTEEYRVLVRVSGAFVLLLLALAEYELFVKG